MNAPLARLLKFVFFAAVAVVLFVSPAQLQAQCWANFDFDGTNPPGSVSDYVSTVRFILGFGPAPANLYELDITGDCIVDQLDLERWECYFIYGQVCLQLPVATCCNPDTTRGACCIRIDSCAILNPLHCTSGYYQGDGVPCGTGFACPLVCGDVNGTGTVTISDVIGLIVCIFSCGPGDWLIAGDSNCSGSTTISDAVYLIRYIFAGGPAPCASCP